MREQANATLLVLVVIAAMTATALQAWRLWTMQASVWQQRERWYLQWFALDAGFQATCHVLAAGFDQYAQQASAHERIALPLMAGLRAHGIKSILMQATADSYFLVQITTDRGQSMRFLVEKEQHDSNKQIVVHHVTFGAGV